MYNFEKDDTENFQEVKLTNYARTAVPVVGDSYMAAADQDMIGQMDFSMKQGFPENKRAGVQIIHKHLMFSVCS